MKNAGLNFSARYFPFFRKISLSKEKKNILYTLNKKLVKVGHVGIKGGSSLVNHLVD